MLWRWLFKWSNRPNLKQTLRNHKDNFTIILWVQWFFREFKDFWYHAFCVNSIFLVFGNFLSDQCKVFIGLFCIHIQLKDFFVNSMIFPFFIANIKNFPSIQWFLFFFFFFFVYRQFHEISVNSIVFLQLISMMIIFLPAAYFK